MSHFPNQTVSESEKKKPEWLNKHFDYADGLYNAMRNKNDKFSNQVKKFNGETDPLRYDTLVKVKSTKTSKSWVDYKWVYTKVTVLNNEYMKRPLPTYVYTTNRNAINAKELKKAQILGMYAMKNEVAHLRNLGVPVFSETPVPENEDALQKALDIKTKNEVDFSTILSQCITKKNLITDFARNNMHMILGMRTFGKVNLMADGRVDYMVIDPRNEISEQHENDPFRKRSQIMGSIIYLTASEIVLQYGKFLTADEIANIYARELASNLETDQQYKYYRKSVYDNQFEFAVTHIEWKTYNKIYYKISKDNKDPEMPYKIEITEEEYLELQKGKKSGYTLETERKKNIMEGVRIGHNIYCMCGYKKYCLPNKEFSYVSCEINSFDGQNISLVDLADEFSFLLNSINLQIRETLRRFVGTVIVIDEGMLPANTDAADVLYNIIEDGLIKVNSKATGNAAAMNFDNISGISVQNINSVGELQQLLMLRNEIKRDLDEITAVNKERAGATLASQTATAARQNISQSRVISYHINLYTDLFVRSVLEKYVEYIRISHAFIKNIEESGLLDELGIAYIRLDPEASFDRLGVQIANIEREIEVRERLTANVIPLAVQRDKIEIEDYLRIEISDTVNDMIDTLQQAMQRKQKITDAIEQQANQMQQQQIQQQGAISTQLQNDKQQNELDKIIIKGHVESANKTLEAKNAALLEREKKILVEEEMLAQQQAQNQAM